MFRFSSFLRVLHIPRMYGVAVVLAPLWGHIHRSTVGAHTSLHCGGHMLHCVCGLTYPVCTQNLPCSAVCLYIPSAETAFRAYRREVCTGNRQSRSVCLYIRGMYIQEPGTPEGLTGGRCPPGPLAPGCTTEIQPPTAGGMSPSQVTTMRVGCGRRKSFRAERAQSARGINSGRSSPGRWSGFSCRYPRG